jgi:endonuclease YncB( thermonuclease family)
MAWVFDRYVKDRSLYPLQERARAQRLGLWADAQPMPPWEWRAARGATSVAMDAYTKVRRCIYSMT